MADGKDFSKDVPPVTPSAGADASHTLISDAQTPMPTGKGAEAAKPADATVAQVTPPTDAKGYDFNVADAPPSVQEHFAGTPQENLDGSAARIAAIHAKVTTPEGQEMLRTATKQMVEHFNAPALEKVGQGSN